MTSSTWDRDLQKTLRAATDLQLAEEVAKGTTVSGPSEEFCAGCRKTVSMSPLTARAAVSSCPLRILELQLRLPPLHLLRLGQLQTSGVWWAGCKHPSFHASAVCITESLWRAHVLPILLALRPQYRRRRPHLPRYICTGSMMGFLALFSLAGLKFRPIAVECTG